MVLSNKDLPVIVPNWVKEVTFDWQFPDGHVEQLTLKWR